MTASHTPRPGNGPAQPPFGTRSGQSPQAAETPLAADELLSTVEVAQITRTPSATLRYWRYAGIGPRSFHLGPRAIRYKKRDVLKWLDEQYGAAG